MFACQNFLQKSCGKFYKEQKLFYSHLMKVITSSSKVTHKAELGLFPTLRKNFLSLATLQFAWSILKTSYLSNQANLALALVDNVVELSYYSNFVNYIIF